MVTDRTTTFEATATLADTGEQCNGELTIHQPVEFVRSAGATKPDPSWRYTDQQGHEHAADGEDFPTLTPYSVHVPCDGSCGGACEGEGYYTTRYRCALCGEEIEPRFVPDYQARQVGIPIELPKWWEATLSTHRPGDSELQVTFATPAGEMSGVCRVTGGEISSGPDGRVAKITVAGTGPLMRGEVQVV